MSRILENIEVSLDESLEEALRRLSPSFCEYRILHQSLDARRRHQPHFVYNVEVSEGPQDPLKPITIPLERISFDNRTKSSQVFTKEKPIIIGAGPAGLFAALRFVERGLPCRLFERGSAAEKRIPKINRFWRYGELDPNNNVCFGEGGAGLFSDGKLITRIKSPFIPYVLNRLVQFGAPSEIEYLANPHVGSDRLRRIIPKLRGFLQANGCEIHFETQIRSLLREEVGSSKSIIGVETSHGEKFYSSKVILATGHSADDVFQHLWTSGIKMEGKSYAIGLRIEHPQNYINKIQYREFAEHPRLSAANYHLTHHNKKENLGVYSFCMCPGGYVLSCGTSTDGLVSNGMSNYHRNSGFANAAIVVTLDYEKLFGKDDILAGLHFRRALEQKAYQSVISSGGSKELPVQNLISFLENKNTSEKKYRKETTSPTLLNPSPLSKKEFGSSPSGAIPVDLSEILPSFIKENLIEGLLKFNKSMPGYISEKAQLYGVETRTSSPLRITRDKESLESLSHSGLYPCGEGAGYAGGITSAACDGVKVAEKIIDSLLSQNNNSL